MMRLPWRKRADDEQQHRMKAQKRLQEAKADWPKVQQEAKRLRDGRQSLDEWTAQTRRIFADRRHLR